MNERKKTSSLSPSEFDAILRQVAHAFEGDREYNRPRLSAFVQYYRDCETVLDIGCGDGLMLELLHQAGIRCKGLDIDPHRVVQVRRNGFDAIHAEAFRYLRETEERFDGIFLRHVIEHFDGPEALELLSLCARVLNPVGILALITPNFENLRVAHHIFWLDITHKRPYPLLLLKEMFTSLGFKILSSGIREDEPEEDVFIVGKLNHDQI